MRICLCFGIYQPRDDGEVLYSTSDEIRDFKVKQLPPLGTRMRFDRPMQNDDGRYYLEESGQFSIDGGDAIHAKVTGIQSDARSDLDRADYHSIQLEVERDNDTPEHAAYLEKYVKNLISAREYARALKRARNIRLTETAFTPDIVRLLQNNGCHNVQQVALQPVGKYTKEEEQLIETVLVKHFLRLAAA